MTHPKNLPNRSEWALLAFDAMHSEHTIMLKQQWMLFKIQLLKMQLRSKPQVIEAAVQVADLHNLKETRQATLF